MIELTANVETAVESKALKVIVMLVIDNSEVSLADVMT